MRLRTVLALLAVLLPTVAAGGALAHTGVTGTVPENGETLDAAPGALLVTMSSPPARLETATVTLAGRDVAGFARLDPEDARLLVIPIKGSAPGRYVGTWVVAAADGHRISGSTSFTVSGGSLVERIVELGALMSDVGTELGEAHAGRT